MYKQVLNQSELQLLDTIDAAITRRYRLNEVHTELDENDSTIGQFMEKVSVIDKNLKGIIEHMDEQNCSKEIFLESYAEWRENREKCINELKRIAKILHRDRLVANIAKVCGLCLSIGGGIGLMATSAMTTSPESALIGSCALATTGTAIALGASISENVRLVKKIKKARRLIEKDQAYFQDIQEWLNHAEQLQEALNSVLDIDILKDIGADIKKFVHKARKIKNEFKRLRYIEKKANIIISTFVEDTQVPITAIVMIPRIIITAVLLLCKTENRLVCDFASVTFKSAVVVGLLVDNSLQAVGLASKLGFSSVQVLTLATGLVGITLDAVAIVKTGVDIHRKSQSPEAKKILTVATNYTEEVESLDNLYKCLSKENNGVAATNYTEEVKIRNSHLHQPKEDGNPFQYFSQPKEAVSNRFQHFEADVDNRFQHFEADVGNPFQHFEADVGNPFHNFQGDVGNRFQH